MSIADVFSSGTHKQNISHFANIVKLALMDQIITDEEQSLLDRLAELLEIDEEEYKNILKNPHDYPIEPPLSYDDRIERLYNLTKMIMADKSVNGEQIRVLKSIVVGLGFSIKNAEKICSKAIRLSSKNENLDDFTSAIKKANKI